MKKNFIIIIFLSCCISYNCYSQFIIAGQTNDSKIVYHDIDPDIELYLPIFLGDVNLSDTIDINQDGVNDFKFDVSMGSGVSHSIQTSTITPLGQNQISIGRSETKTGWSGGAVTISIAEAYNAGDTIKSDTSFSNNNWCALNYKYSYGGKASFSISDWVLSGEKYIGFKLIVSNDTTFGWIRAYTPANSHFFIRDYAYYDKYLSIDSIYEIPFSIYPNPATDNLTIEIPQITTLEILNIQGQTILLQKLQQRKTNIDISGFAKGVYILRLYSNDKIKVKKIVKK